MEKTEEGHKLKWKMLVPLEKYPRFVMYLYILVI